MTDRADRADLGALDALEAAATPGPWRVGRPATDCTAIKPRFRTGRCDCRNIYEDNGQTDVTHPHAGLYGPDAELIVALRNAYPALRDELRELRAKIVRIHDHANRHENGSPNDRSIALAIIAGWSAKIATEFGYTHPDDTSPTSESNDDLD